MDKIDLSRLEGEYTPEEVGKVVADLKKIIKKMEDNKTAASECDHYYVPIGNYYQNGRFKCQKCGDDL